MTKARTLSMEQDALVALLSEALVTRKDELIDFLDGFPGKFGRYIAGFRLQYANATTLQISAGSCSSDDGTTIINRTSAMTKGLGAFVAGGAGAGALDTGTIAANTWYHVHAIKHGTTGAGDVLLSTSANSPTLPNGWTKFRRIGSILTNASAQITSFLHLGETFMWDTPVADYNVTNPGTSEILVQLTVPPGVNVFPVCNWIVKNVTTSATELLISSPDQTNLAPSGLRNHVATAAAAAIARTNAIVRDVPTDMSRRVRARLSASGASDTVQCVTFGWIDRRGD